MDRQFELRGRLPSQDWEQYSKGKPVYSRDGDYFGRDVADPQSRSWKGMLLDASLLSLGISSPALIEILRIPALLVALPLIAAPKVYDRLNVLLTQTRKVLNPKI